MELEMKLKELFEKNLPDIPLFYYPLTDSTNTRAIEYARSGKAASAFFIAREQTAGRGRRGRSFSSDPGGLYLTFLTKPDMPPKEAIMLTVFASVALLDTVFEFTGKMPAVKWVNDLIMNGKKLAGILTEGAFDSSGGFEYALVGIGVNLYSVGFPDEIRDIAISLEEAAGARVDYADFALSLAKRLSEFSPERIPEYMKRYKESSLAVGRRATVLSAEGSYECDVIAVNDDGSLKVRPLGEAECRDLISGEISIRLK